MTHHGTPLKQMGMDLRDAPARARSSRASCAAAGAGTTASPPTCSPRSAWERAYPAPLHVAGDRLSAQRRARERDRRRRRSAPAAARASSRHVAVLYAPTHREYEDRRPRAARPRARWPTGWPRARRPAPASTTSTTPTAAARLHAPGASATSPAIPSVEELCLAADVLVTDYSSIMFDYAVLDRPIVIHAPDWETYRERRGTYFDLLDRGARARSRARDAEVLAMRRRRPGRRGRARRSASASARWRTATRPSASCARCSATVRESDLLVSSSASGRSGTSLFAGILGPAGLPHPAARGRRPTTRTPRASASRGGSSTSTRG